MSRSHKKHCFRSQKRSHYPSKHKVLKAKKNKIRSLLATRYDDDALLLPGKEKADWNSKAWYESFEQWKEYRRLWPEYQTYTNYYLHVLRK